MAFRLFKVQKERGIHIGTDKTFLGGMTPGTFDFGVDVNNESSKKITAFYAGVRLRAENIASLPRTVNKKDSKGSWVKAVGHPVYNLIAGRPNSYTNAFDFYNQLSANLDGWGNAYAIIKRDDKGDPVSLHQVHPSYVSIVFEGGYKFYKVDILDPDFKWLNGTYHSSDMLHFMLLSYDGIKGVNPVVYNATALGKALATERFAAEYYKRGGNVKGVLETDSHLDDDQYKSFTKHFDSAQNFSTPLLEFGIKYKQLSISPVAAQLLESEKMSINDICRILNIPPHMLSELSHATFSNIEHQTIQFVQYSLRPTLKRFEVELESKLLTRDEREYMSIKFDLQGLLRGDTATRSAFYHNAIQDGWMSRNEVRHLENMPAASGLDEFMRPANMIIDGNEE